MASTPEVAGERPDYLSYLLRLRRLGEDQPVWRASLEDPLSGECRNFASLEALFAFLRQQTGARQNRAGHHRGGDEATASSGTGSYRRRKHALR